MSTRRLWLVPAFLLLLPGEVMAHRHRTGLFYIPSKLFHSNSTSLLGLSGELPISKCHDFSAIGAFSRYSGTEARKDFTLLVYTAGVRHTFKPDGLSPFLQLMGGGVRDTSQHRTRGFAALGGGINIINIKVGEDQEGHQITIRVQADVVRFEGKWGFAPSVGIGFQFPHYKLCDKQPSP